MGNMHTELQNKSTFIFLILGVTLIIAPWLTITTSYININILSENIKFLLTTFGIFFLLIGMIYLIHDLKTEVFKSKTVNESNKSYDHLECFDDNSRKNIIKDFKPDLYLPLEDTFCDVATYPSCDTNIFPHIFVQGDTFENNPFIDKMGYKFNGKNMISVHTKEHLPSGKESRSFIFAIKPTDRPSDSKPMFFFSYGQRKSHECNDGITNHDKSFGVFWGEPQPNEEIEEKFKGQGVRIFFYCEHCKEDRTSENCDTPIIYNIDKLNIWYIFAVTFDGDNIEFYINGEKVYNQKFDISTSVTPFLNIGGFVHHNQDGAMISKDLDYTMKGHIREFIMIRNKLSSDSIKKLSLRINDLLN